MGLASGFEKTPMLCELLGELERLPGGRLFRSTLFDGLPGRWVRGSM